MGCRVAVQFGIFARVPEPGTKHALDHTDDGDDPVVRIDDEVAQPLPVRSLLLHGLGHHRLHRDTARRGWVVTRPEGLPGGASRPS